MTPTLTDTRTRTRLLAILQALADENRLRILDVLREGERCVCELQEPLDMGQSLLSHHLKVLREAGLVTHRREGRWVHYALAAERLAEVETWAGELRSRAGEASGSREARC